ncbi:MAG: phosphotransferase [Bacilli bacterium]|nr:phosphotransferase [Bacilli bacterium]
MNEIISILKKYFNEEDIITLNKNLDKKQRSIIINEKYFAKVGKNTDELFFNNLVREIKLYKNNNNNIILPRILDSLVTNEYCVMILEKINGKTLSNQRNNYNSHLSNIKRIEIAKNVLNIRNIKINYKLEKNYNRKEKLDKYLEKSKPYLSKITYNKIVSLYNILSLEPSNIVIAHGDLILTNIMIDKNTIKFIDWEYISYKPEFYDLTCFLMFSRVHHSLDILDKLNIDKKEVYIDSVILCLKEIQNLSKLYGKIDNNIINKNIERWKKELNYILKEF